jgi:hypothetical protein
MMFHLGPTEEIVKQPVLPFVMDPIRCYALTGWVDLADRLPSRGRRAE